MSQPPSQPNTTPSPAGGKPMDAIMALCKRRGFIYQASEIYGGLNGFWDYGPLGAQLKKNLRDAWWQDVVMNPCGGAKGPTGDAVSIVPLDSTIIQHPKVWIASGHAANFNDPMVDDKETKSRFRADHIMAVYLLTDELLAKAESMRKEIESGQVKMQAYPDFTLVASSPIAAAAALREDRKLIPRLKKCDADGGPIRAIASGAAIVNLDFGDKRVDALIEPLDLKRLEAEPDRFPAPITGKRGTLTPPRAFNLMFKTYVGATATEDDVAYLRPETAQGIFVQFKNVVDTTRVRVPFGIAQTGKAFRNEVTPRNFTFRSREFEQMEIEFFCHESEARAWYGFWREQRMKWWQQIGLAGENLRLREHDKDELAHYAKSGAGVCDVEYRFPFTAPDFGELEGVAHRSNFDLAQHQQHSGTKLEYFDTDRGELLPNGAKKGERYLPHVIEPSAGLDRGVLAILCEAYTVDPARPSPEFMKFHPRVAPIKAAVFPLVNKDGMPEIADKLHAELAARFARVGFIESEAKQSIGKRYARMDEAGCPYCFTIDGESAASNTVTVRERDTGKQERIALDKCAGFLAEKLGV